MNAVTGEPAFEGGNVRPDYVPAANYVSQRFADLEAEHLWPRVWQMACREEEIPTVGSFYTYDIVDDSITVVRTKPDEIRAFHNSCPHRGRRITEGCGKSARLHCRFHGWQWDLEGRNLKVVDRDDWGRLLTDEDVALSPVKVGRWGGWVYINMDPDCESLEDFLSPAKAYLDPYDLGGLRYHWRKSTILPCNWKVALEAFNEGYHVQTTHSQLLKYFDDMTTSYAHGRHGMFTYAESAPMGFRSPRLGGPESDDNRPLILAYMENMRETLNAITTDHGVVAGKRLMEEVPAGSNPYEVLGKFGQFIDEDAAAQGAQLPTMTMEQMMAGGVDWHLFPNQIMLQSTVGLLGYRARPNGHDPHSCVWDVYSLRRYAPGAEPKVSVEWSDDLKDVGFWGKILVQDYDNMGEVHRGMRSRSFRGARTNPKQEVAVSNFHRALHDFIADGAKQA
ncbi:SRPBCC family protein [Novosphingobium sp.]|uniref:aromatic ring-hydroxylating oxygenase subunit alpha n=1 Tax=Novosphingobium sp. TaxID=1874826 RepID=UPI00261EA6FD|nr:SRPBCC family protein [Novosphingobium sp.]